MKPIVFNSVPEPIQILDYFKDLLSDYDLFKNKKYSNLSLEILKKQFLHSGLFLTHSATGALEMIALLMDLKEGDEIIMPSFTFVSSANSFASRGAVPVFVDIDPDTLNIDPNHIEAAISPKTKAIIVVHYAGHACDLSQFRKIADQHQLFLIEDAAMGYGCYYQNKPLGSWGDFGVISFDITKQISAIQGGLLIINNKKYTQRGSHIYHIGTNREDFNQKQIPYYEWVDKGSKFQMNELNAAVLYENLLQGDSILKKRNHLSKKYFELLAPLAEQQLFKIMSHERIISNVHEFYLICPSKDIREKLTHFLKQHQIEALFHYIPLHNSSYGLKNCRNHQPTVTIQISETLLRLPLHINMTEKDVEYVCEMVKKFFNEQQ